MAHKFNIASLLKEFEFANSVSSDLFNRSLSAAPIKLLVDYDSFQDHIFFGNALRRVTSNLNRIIDEYPIGLSGTAVNALSAANVAAWENWSLQASDFQKYLLNFVCGATAVNLSPNLTASATSNNGEIVTINIFERNTSNQVLSATAVENINSILEIASLYDEGEAKFRFTSGTGSEMFVIPTRDDILETKYVPATIGIETNRNPEFEKNFPDLFSDNDSEENFQNFLSVYSEFFDSLKSYIDQFPNLFSADYSGFNRMPEGLMQFLVAKQMGIDLFEGVFSGNLAYYYQKLGAKGLQKITHEIWNRIMCDSSDLLKAKGTPQAFNQLVRDFGIYNGFISTREYVDNIETSENVYEKKTTVKLPLFSNQEFNYLTITATNSASALTSLGSSFTVMGQTILPFLSSATGNITPIVSLQFGTSNQYYVEFYFNGNIGTFGLSKTVTFPSLSTSTITSVSSSLTADFIEEYQNQLTPFAIKFNASTSSIILDTKVVSLTTSSTAFLTASSNALSTTLLHLNYASMSGGFASSASYSNIKFFNKFLDSTTSYFVNPHSRYLEDSMMYDYKLYDSPSASTTGNVTLTAVNSFIDTTLNSYWRIDASVSSYNYELYPLVFNRRFTSQGGILPAGDMIVIDRDSKKRGSSNFGYGLFSSEAINNDILDFYTSNSAVNVGQFFADPATYYFDEKDSRVWENLKVHRNEVINQTRYSTGINYDKFIRFIYNYRYILSNFFLTADQFIRFKSKIFQKGVNIEPTLLDRDKQRIDSSLSAIQNIVVSQERKIPSTKLTSASAISLTAIRNFSSSGSFVSNTSLSGYRNLTGSLVNVNQTSLSGYKSITSCLFSTSYETSSASLIDKIAYKGIKFSDRFSYSNFSQLTDQNNLQTVQKNIDSSAKTKVFVNKDIIETSKNIVTPLSGTFDVVYYSNGALTGVRKSLIFSFDNSSYIKGYNIITNFNSSGSATEFSGAFNKNFIGFFKDSIPVTGTLLGLTTNALSSTVSGQAQGQLLRNNFKDLGSDTENAYFRQRLRLNISVEKNGKFLRDKSNMFEIDCQLEKQTNQPIFHFYCYNNDTYYQNFPFRIPCFSENVQFLVTFNPIFSDMTLGQQNIFITNLMSNEKIVQSINVVQVSSDLKDTFAERKDLQSSEFTENKVLTSTDITTNGYVVFGQAKNRLVDQKSIKVLLNGNEQQQFVFWTYLADGTNNKLVFSQVSGLTSGDVVTIKYTY